MIIVMLMLSAIRDALILQKEELNNKSSQLYIKRIIKISGIKSDMIKVITGPRRAGKSFFVMHELTNNGKFAYANFDDEVFANASDYNEIVTEMNSLYDKPGLFLLDEIQNLPNWELFINRLQRQGYNIVITGSNSNLLSGELSTHLTGRHIATGILPLSFREFITHDKRELTTAELKNKFSEYAKYGGYPEPLVKSLDYREYLSTLFDSILYRDIVKRYRIRKSDVIDELAIYLISSSAKEFSYNNLVKMTGVDSQHTAKKYIGYLSEAFIFFEVKRYSAKVKEQITTNKKIYCIDNGFVYAKGFKTSGERGRSYENLVAIELKRRASEDAFEFYYWKNVQQEEIDFVIVKHGKIAALMQVSADVSGDRTKEREVRALLKGSKELKCTNLIVLTEDYESEEEVSWFGITGRVQFVPLWKWLTGTDGEQA